MVESPASRKLAASSVIVATLATAGALYLASDFFVPLVFGLVLTGLLWPAVQQLKRWRIPTAAGSAICVLGTVAILGAIIVAFAPPIKKFANEIPKTIAAARPKITALSAELGRYTGSTPASTAKPKPKSKSDSTSKDTAKSSVGKDSVATNSSNTKDSSGTASSGAKDSAVAQTIATDSSKTATKNAQDTSKAPPKNSGANSASSGVPESAPATIAHALGIATGVLGDFVEVILLAMFILAAGDSWLKKLAEAIPNATRREAIVDTINQMRSVVTRYLVTTTLINLAQATVVAIALHFLGYPTVVLWGVLTFFLEFIPYFGGMANLGLLFAAGLGAGKGLGGALAGPAAYLIITTLQNNVVSPIAYGKSLRLNPTAILAGLMLWYMLWGVAGAFLAVPILAAFSVLASRVKALKGVEAFISD
ncbi:MAG: AI-2E family transporter [Gemmatimonadaceae bacterium]